MNLFELYAKISVDDTDFKKSMGNAQKVSKNVANAMKELQSPLDKAKSGFNAIAHPIETAKQGFETLKNKTEALRHPIETLKSKFQDSATALETQRNKLSVLASGYDSAKKKVDDLTKEFNKSAKESGTSSEKTQELAKKLNEAEREAAEAKKELDDYSASVSKAGKNSESASNGIEKFGNILGDGLKTAAKIGAAAVGAAATGIATLTTAAVNNYAEYEQLVGGVETLFKTSSDKVMGYAENAYKTAGLSANEYMDTVTSFSASLLQSLDGDTAAAAEKADLAITDMADNANKMGTSMESIQNAYQGFAKQNYTMLDNLKLGYGGTKEEMQRLITDAAELSDTVDAQSMSFDNIVEAIHVVQTEMGITGTTAKEAGMTIQGSVASMKSAWTNLLTGLADGNADIEQLVDDLVTTVVGDGTESNLGVLGNILPAVETALNGASALVGKALPEIMDVIPTIINDNLPVLAEAAISIVQSLMDGISQNQEMLFDTILDVVTYLTESFVTMLPQIVQLGLDLIVSLANGISESLPELIPTIIDVVLQIVDTITNPETLANLVDASIAIIMELADGLITALPKLIDKIPTIIDNIVAAITENLPKIIEMGIKLVIKLAGGLIQAIPQLVSKVPQIITSLVNGFVSCYSKVFQIGKDLVSKVGEGFKNMLSSAANWGKDMIDNFIGGIKQKWESLKSTVANVAQSVKDFLGFSEPKKGPLSNFHTYAPDMMDLFAKGIRDNEDVVTDQIEKSFDFGERTIKFGTDYGDGFGIASATGAIVGGTSIRNVTINIDGAKYSDENSLAEAIAEALQNMTDRRSAVYA